MIYGDSTVLRNTVSLNGDSIFLRRKCGCDRDDEPENFIVEADELEDVPIEEDEQSETGEKSKNKDMKKILHYTASYNCS